jgi:hypothetical protein
MNRVTADSGGGTFGLATPANTRNHYTLSAVLTGLPPGFTRLGYAGIPRKATRHWISNEFGDTTALVIQ